MLMVVVLTSMGYLLLGLIILLPVGFMYWFFLVDRLRKMITTDDYSFGEYVLSFIIFCALMNVIALIGLLVMVVTTI